VRGCDSGTGDGISQKKITKRPSEFTADGGYDVKPYFARRRREGLLKE